MPARKTEKKYKPFDPEQQKKYELAIHQLTHRCDPESLGFKSTDELPDLQEVLGQPRAIRALEIGSEVSGPGYNIFVVGLPASGRTTLSKEHLERKAVSEPVPDDWCYVQNFDNPRAPKAIRLTAGKGIEFRRDMEKLIQHCKSEIPKAFESKEYAQERDRIINEVKKKQEAAFIQLQQLAEQFSFIVARTPFGIVLAPAIEGKPLKPEELEKLSEEQRQKLEKLQTRLGEEVEKTLQHLRELGEKANQKLNELNQSTIDFILLPFLNTIQKKYQENPSVLSHLEAVHKDILENANRFASSEGEEQKPSLPIPIPEADWTTRYAVNLIVDNSATKGAPVVVETHPTYHNLLGRIEHEVFMGASRTDFTLIRAGAFHRANGGYLIIPARDLLISPYAWEGVKRVLRDGCIRILELGSLLGLLSTETLEPEPIPLNVKVILVGTPLLYYLLEINDEDFSKLFKVKAEFTHVMDRTPEAEKEYGLFIKSVVLDNHLPPFDHTAVARIIEHSSRMAEDQHKLSTRFGLIADVAREAAYWANKNHRKRAPVIVTAKDVEKAIQESIYRRNLIDERIQEMIAQGTIQIETRGKAIGSANALSVYYLDDISFGKPNRVTAAVSPGRGGVTDIERQADLSGRIHTKGFLILSGFLNSRYASSGPLSISASITFEQSYSEIEGDSASAAELFALLSAIANVPIRQDIAITGAINQQGQVLAVGGVNEKIEGFYQICKALKLSGTQGVIIPKANLRNLMLQNEVLEAISKGRFHIWAIANVDEGLSILSGIQAGQKDRRGRFPQGTFNAMVVEKLEQFSELLKETPPKNTKKNKT